MRSGRRLRAASSDSAPLRLCGARTRAKAAVADTRQHQTSHQRPPARAAESIRSRQIRTAGARAQQRPRFGSPDMRFSNGHHLGKSRVHQVEYLPVNPVLRERPAALAQGTATTSRPGGSGSVLKPERTFCRASGAKRRSLRATPPLDCGSSDPSSTGPGSDINDQFAELDRIARAFEATSGHMPPPENGGRSGRSCCSAIH
jgi:hypothetical protein